MGRSLRGQYSGVVRYTYDLVRALAPQLGDRLTVFLTRASDGLDDLRVRRIRAPFPTPNEYARALWEQTIVPLQVARLAPQVYHSPNYILPLGLRCPTVVTVHDLAFLDRSVHRLRSHLYLSVLTRLAIQKATRIICVSAYTRDRLVERFPQARGRTRVVGEGVDERFRRAPPDAIDRFRRRHGIDRPYVLFVGTMEPRKNLARLIRAFGRAVDSTGSPHTLVIAGGLGWKNADVQAARRMSAVAERIQVLGYLPDDELPAALSGADLFAYPSLAEGFGLPPLEAMACGTPVLTSNVTSLPAVVGDAALMVDPLDETAIVAGLASLMVDGETRQRLAEAGPRRAARFRWPVVAQETLAVYAEAAG